MILTISYTLLIPLCKVNAERSHQALGYWTPGEVYAGPVESDCGGVIESQSQLPVEISLRVAGERASGIVVRSKVAHMYGVEDLRYKGTIQPPYMV